MEAKASAKRRALCFTMENLLLNIIGGVIFLLILAIPTYKVISEDYSGMKKWIIVIVVLAIFLISGWLYNLTN